MRSGKRFEINEMVQPYEYFKHFRQKKGKYTVYPSKGRRV